MKKITIYNSMKVLFFLLLATIPAAGQEVYPGDVNNNGIANGVDLLYLGKAFNATGTPRADQNIDYTPKIFSPWAGMFPNGENFGLADSNGDGVVTETDKEAIDLNYGLTHLPVIPDVYEGNGLPIIDPSLVLLPVIPEVIEGETLEVPVILGNVGIPVTDFHGITFSVLYDPTFVNEDVTFEQLPSFIDLVPGDESINLVTNKEPGVANIAITRTDNNLTSGFGTIGTLSFIIVEDVITFLPADTFKVIIDSVLMLDQNLEPIPLAIENTEVLVFPDTTNSTTDWDPEISMNIFPNPISTTRIFTIDKSGVPISHVELFNTFGQAVPLTDDSMTVFEILDRACPPGVYFLKIETPKGLVSRKLILE